MHPSQQPSHSKSGLNFLLQPTNPSSSQRLAALSLERADALPPNPHHSHYPSPNPHSIPSLSPSALPSLPPLRARSADSGLPPPHPPTHPSSLYRLPVPRQESTLSDVTRDFSMSSAPSLVSIPSLSSRVPSVTPPVGRMPAGRRPKTEQELRDKREQRRMKNRLSAARSRQRKTDTFETLQRELAEAKNVIQALTLQLHSREHASRDSGAPGKIVLAVPNDLRSIVGRDYVSAEFLMDLLRMYIRRAPG